MGSLYSLYCSPSSSYLEFLLDSRGYWATGLGWDNLPFIWGLSTWSCPRHTDKRQPGSGSRMKLSCLNLSLKRQPELFRCFHSASGRDSTRKVRAEETGSCQGAEGKGQSCCLQEGSTKVPSGYPWPTTCLWNHSDPGTPPWCWHTALAGSSGTHPSSYIELVHTTRGTTFLCVTQRDGNL